MTFDATLAVRAPSAWRAVAACADLDPDLFFPVGSAGHVARQVRKAKRVCRSCPATAACLAWALESHQDLGVVGGLNAAERDQLEPSTSAGSP